MSNQITEQQLESLTSIIYETLIANPENGLGEIGACKEAADAIVNKWINKEGIEVIAPVKIFTVG